MRHIFSVLTTIIITMGALSSCSIDVDYKQEEEKIKEVWMKTSEYLSKGDWENYSKLVEHTEKLQVIHPGTGQWLKGYNEFSSVYKSILESDYTYTEYKNDLLNVNISKSGDMAWANAEVVWSMDNGENKNHMWYACNFEKIDGEWKTVMLFASGVKQKD